MNAALDPAVSRFAALQDRNEEEAELLRGKMQAFRNLYGFLSQIIPYQDSDLERLHVFLRHLSAKLPRRRRGPAYRFDDEVRLEYYRLQKIAEGSIALRDGEAQALDGPSEVGSGLAREQEVPLSQLIDIVNSSASAPTSTRQTSSSSIRSSRRRSETRAFGTLPKSTPKTGSRWCSATSSGGFSSNAWIRTKRFSCVT